MSMHLIFQKLNTAKLGGIFNMARLALDNQISRNCAKALQRAGHEVVYHTRHEHDQLWFRRARELGANVFVSPDWDIDLLCNQYDIKCIRIGQRLTSEETLIEILKVIGLANQVNGGINA